MGKKTKRSKYDSSSESDSSSSSSSDSESESVSSSGIDLDEFMEKKDDEKNEGNNDDLNDFKNINFNILNWKRVRLSDKSKTYKIKKLVHGWSYLVRIRGKNESGWGPYSDPIKVSTKTIELKWNHHKHGKGVTFLTENRCKFSSKQAKICVDYKINNYSWIGFVRGPAKQYISNWNYYLGGNNANE